MSRTNSCQQSSIIILFVAAASVFGQAYEYIFPLGRGWVYDYGAGLETIPVHIALVNQHALGGSLAPFVAGGVDRLSFFGNADSPLLLSTWLLAFLSPAVANGFHMLLQGFIGSAFTGLLCHDRFKLGTPISAVATVAYTSFTYPVFGFLFNSALVPFFAWFLTVPYARSWGVLLLIGFAASCLTSLSQGFPFIALFIALWMPIIARASIRTTAQTLAAITIGYLFGKLPTLFAILGSVNLSQRSGELRYDSLIDTPILYTESDFLFSNHHMWTYTQVVPAFFAALCVIFLAGSLLQRLRKLPTSAKERDGEYRYIVILKLGIIYAILASGILMPVRTFLIPTLPWLGSVNMVRTITASGALLNALVVAHGLSVVETAIKRRAIGSIIAMTGMAAAITWAIRHPSTFPAEYALLLLLLATGTIIFPVWNSIHATDDSRAANGIFVLVPTAALAAFYACVAPKILLFPLRDAPQSGIARYYIPAIPEIERRDQTLHRYASVLPLQPANALANGVETLDGWANLYSSRFRQFWLTILKPLLDEREQDRRIFGTDENSPQDHYIFLGSGASLPSDPTDGMDIDHRFNLNLLSLMNVRYLLSYYPLTSKYLAEIHVPARPLEREIRDYATGRIVVPGETDSGWPVMKGLMSAIEGSPRDEDQVYAYRNVCALPRVFSVAQIVRHSTDRDVLQSLVAASPRELLRTAHILAADAPPVGDHLSAMELRISTYRAGEINVEATGSGEAIIIFANTWIPGWKAYIDGHEAPIFRANHTQIGLHLPAAGTFHIRLAYEPSYRWLTDIFAAPTKLIASVQPTTPELGDSQLPPICAMTNVGK